MEDEREARSREGLHYLLADAMDGAARASFAHAA